MPKDAVAKVLVVYRGRQYIIIQIWIGPALEFTKPNDKDFGCFVLGKT